MNHVATRRDVLSTILSTSIGAVLPVPKYPVNEAKVSKPSREEQHDFQAIRKQILQAIAQGAATGVGVAVTHRGRIIWEEGFGWANREAALKVTSRTAFSLASITKPFTATTLLTLVAEGKVSLDDPVNRYLSNSPIKGTNGNVNDATVRLLGAHASGLPVMFEEYLQDEADLARSPDALLREYGRLAYPPGSCYEYSNIGFAALGAIASSLTGTDFGTLMTQRVLTPLGLHDSFFDTNVARLPTGAARYDPVGNPILYYTTSTPASGELYASAHDLAHFAMFNMKTYSKDQSRILDDRWIGELHKPVHVGPAGVATTFGWFSAQLKSGAPVIFKNGGQAGVATILYMVPSEELACLVLTNRSDGRELAYRVCNHVLASYLPEWHQPEEASGPSPSPFVATSSFGGRWQGTLTHGGTETQIRLNIESSDSAFLALGNKAAEKITGMQSEGAAFTGTSAGLIESPDAIRTGARTLKIKLIPHGTKLVGRVLATAGDPNFKNVMLPYVLSLNRIG
jgi:CubicO group peptidase (beta-lactamase class C family)